MSTFDPELDTLLDAERRAPAPMDALARVSARLAVSVMGGVAGGAGSTLTRRHGWLASHAGAVAAAAFVAGGVVGATIYAVAQKPPKERILYVDRPVLTAPIASSKPTERWTPQPLPSTKSAPTLSPPRPSASSIPAESLTAERAMLDQARSAITSGDATHALTLLDEHAKRFHKPQLAEEREALAVQSLVLLGRADEARARATRLREASPNSLFLPVIESALGSIP